MSILLDDPIEELLKDEKPSAKIVPDPVNGYDKVVLDDDLLEEIGLMYAQAIRETDKDLEPQHKEVVDNQLVYDCKSDKDEIITVPVAKRIADQQVAWAGTAILSKDPYITVKALDSGSYEIPSQVYAGEVIPGFEALGAIPQFDMKEVPAEQAAKLYERLIDYDLRELIDFEQLVEDTGFSIHVGENPTYWKIPYNPNVRYAKQRHAVPNAKGRIQFLGVEDTQVIEAKSVDITHIYGPNITMPVGENDIQKSWWLAEKMRLTNTDIWEGFKKGAYDLGRPLAKGSAPVPDSEILTILGFAEDINNSESGEMERRLAQIDNLVAQNPRRDHDVREVWFYHPIRTSNGIEIRSLCGTLHLRSGKFLNLYVNPYWHAKRPYVPFYMKKRPHKAQGYSTVENVAPIQRLMSYILHGQLQNMVQQNVKVFLVRENSATWRFMNRSSFQLKPGVVIPFDQHDDINPQQLGTQVQSMANEIQFLDDTADKLTVSRDWSQIPNRTAAATVAQIDANAAVQPQTVLRAMRRGIAAAIKMYFQTVAQFHQYRTIPFLEPDTNHLVSTLIGFPRQIIENQFSFHVTATGDDDSRQAKQEKTLLNLVQTDSANAAALKLMDTILDPNVPDEAKDVATFLLLRRERLYGELIANSRLDVSKFALTDQIVQKLRKAVADKAANTPPPQPPPPPPPPPDQPKISLSALIPPELVIPILQQAYPNLQMGQAPPPPPEQGAPNAAQPQQLPPAGPGQPLPALPAGQPGSGGSPGEPGNDGVANSGPPAAPIPSGIPAAV